MFQALYQMLEFLRPAFHQCLKSADLVLKLFQGVQLQFAGQFYIPKYSQPCLIIAKTADCLKTTSFWDLTCRAPDCQWSTYIWLS